MGSIDQSPVSTSGTVLQVNGQSHRLEIRNNWALLEVLREQLDLTGTKNGCDRGECGSCTATGLLLKALAVAVGIFSNQRTNQRTERSQPRHHSKIDSIEDTGKPTKPCHP